MPKIGERFLHIFEQRRHHDQVYALHDGIRRDRRLGSRVANGGGHAGSFWESRNVRSDPTLLHEREEHGEVVRVVRLVVVRVDRSHGFLDSFALLAVETGSLASRTPSALP